MNFEILMKIQKEEENQKEIKKEIEDLESELDWIIDNEPTEAKYIMFLQNRIRKLYSDLLDE